MAFRGQIDWCGCMAEQKVFPRWIEDDYNSFRKDLTLGSVAYIDQFRKEYAALLDKLADLPPKVRLREFYKASPETLRKYFPDAFTAMSHLCRTHIGAWYYRHAYKLEAYSDGFDFSLEKGNWLGACNCLRNITEEIGHFDYFLSRMERKERS